MPSNNLQDQKNQRKQWAVLAITLIIGALFAITIGLIIRNGTVVVDRETSSADPAQPEPVGKPAEMAVSEYLSLTTVDDAVTRQAVCMDGSPAAYYFRRGTGEGVKNWLVVLEGGSSCHSASECQESRKDPDFSSRKLKPTKRLGGIFSIDSASNPDFYNWNQIYLNNCNAGNWGGDDAFDIKGHTYHFRGAKIIEAVLADQAGLAQASRLVFAGSSGGGTGVGQNLDLVAANYPNVDVRGVIDSSYEIEYTPYATVAAIDPAAGFDFINSNVDEDCGQAYASQPWLCLKDNYLYPHLSTPVFTYQDLLDSHKLEDNGITDATEPSQVAWIDDYVNALSDSLAELDGVFAPTVGEHVALTNERFTTAKIDEHTFAEILGNWVFDRQAPKNLIATP